MFEYIELKSMLELGMSTREIGKIKKCSGSNVEYWVHKFNLTDSMKYQKPEYTNENYFNKIDSKEKAYIIGYLLADGYITNKYIECGCQISDKEILEFISNETGANIIIDNNKNTQKRRFPRARIQIGNKKLVSDVNKHCGGIKNEKKIPRISDKYEKYLVLGFFDGDGCFTFGRRKDRNRIWQKFNFTSSYQLLIGIQNILIKNNITSVIRPKTNEQVFVLESHNKENVIKFLDYIYQDEEFIILKRKYEKAKALRRELGEFGET